MPVINLDTLHNTGKSKLEKFKMRPSSNGIDVEQLIKSYVARARIKIREVDLGHFNKYT
jgi:hypothetical protein